MNLPNNKWIKSIAKGGNVAATAIIATELVEDARIRHNLQRTGDPKSPSEAKALGEALIAGLLLASNCKSGERISLSVKGDHYLKQTLVDANPNGTARGFVLARTDQSTNSFPDSTDKTKGPWQNGLLSVVRLKQNEKEPYVGTVPTVTGHLAKDLTFYLLQSEQIPAAVGLAVSQDKTGKIDAAGGFLVQVVPGATRKEITRIEQNINKLQALAKEIAKNQDPTVLLGQIFDDMTFMILEEKPLRFECTCSKDRILRALNLLGPVELMDMMSKDHGAKVHCDFCSKLYDLSEKDLSDIISSR